uniref:Uncharacterized protein n=1 Tax=Trypanosoma congolense (strain IL3000) TaxID=1068625 RepID=G0UUB3_TRYCI|nr:hypothetical protein, unlikely [Trypanosoma congolense IL3000]
MICTESCKLIFSSHVAVPFLFLSPNRFLMLTNYYDSKSLVAICQTQLFKKGMQNRGIGCRQQVHARAFAAIFYVKTKKDVEESIPGAYKYVCSYAQLWM